MPTPRAVYPCRLGANFGLLFGAAASTLLGQGSSKPYEALKDALRLSDYQVMQLQQRSLVAAAVNPPPTGSAARRTTDSMSTTGWIDLQMQNANSLRNQVLDDSQQSKLKEIEKVLDRWDAASLAITLGLIAPQRWPGISLCYYPIRSYASELSLSDSQILQLERLQQAARDPLYAQIAEKETHRVALLNSGSSADSAAVVHLISEISELGHQATETRPRRDLALATLDDTQKAKVAAFETALQLASEAIELGLIPVQPKGEVLCH
jgi:hypothetical protein